MPARELSLPDGPAHIIASLVALTPGSRLGAYDIVVPSGERGLDSARFLQGMCELGRGLARLCRGAAEAMTRC